MSTPLKGETGEKVDNKGAFNVTSFGGKEGGKVGIKVNGKLKDVCVQWVKGGFKPRCLNASPPRTISTAALTTRKIARKREPTALAGCAPARRRSSKSSCGVSHHISNSTFEEPLYSHPLSKSLLIARPATSARAVGDADDDEQPGRYLEFLRSTLGRYPEC